MKLLVSEATQFSPAALRALESVADVERADLDRAELTRRIGDVDAVWVRLRHRLDAGLFAAAPRLRFVISPTTGLNHIDLEAAERAGVMVVSLRGEAEFLKEVRATAELTVALTLALLRKLPEAIAHARAGGWNRDLFLGHELYQKTVGVVGFGRLGRLVAGYFVAFGCRVLACDLEAREPVEGVEFTALAALLARADIVSLHADFRPSNRAFFGAREFMGMKQGAVFINTARGELVDEEALLNSLRSGRLAGAALDVLAEERSEGMADHPLVRHAQTDPRLLISPHIGGLTRESIEKTEIFMAEKFARLVRERAPR